ncbi:hypothetical protein DPMN_132421 [Dreissena polymorpha]|uniref:Uncharacterized protein n=1 Tax=Dreissena polymorpha TaxID=45954 RepID=A0A9D4JC21_DREPO|nr:hypothetical protein DPMN_132421 [Dreissena polymorpha]
MGDPAANHGRPARNRIWGVVHYSWGRSSSVTGNSNRIHSANYQRCSARARQLPPEVHEERHRRCIQKILRSVPGPCGERGDQRTFPAGQQGVHAGEGPIYHIYGYLQGRPQGRDLLSGVQAADQQPFPEQLHTRLGDALHIRRKLPAVGTVRPGAACDAA